MLSVVRPRGSASKSVVSWGQADANDQFAAGNAAMMINGPWQFPILDKKTSLHYDVVQIPVPKTGDTPVVDVQSSSLREVLSQDLLDAIPTGRSFVLMANTVPAVTTGGFDVGGSSAMWTGGSLNAHGSQSRDSRTLIDGMVADAMFSGGQCACVYYNEAQTQEIAVQVSGGGAESQLSGVLVNRIPRSGGNKFAGEFMTNFSNTSLWSQNTDDDLVVRGFTVPAKLFRQYDVNYTVDGPIIRDRLWFFISGRNWAYNNYVLGGLKPDGSRYFNDNYARGFPVQITTQLSRRDRVTGLINYSTKGQGSSVAGGWQGPAVTAPAREATPRGERGRGKS